MNKKRLDYIDITKGLGMLAIIWGHIMLYGWSCQMVYGFHIPVFFMLSGMCFNQNKYSSVWELIRRRVKTLLIPYVVFSVATWLVYVAGVFVLHNDTMQNCWYYLLQTVLAQGSDGYLKHNVALWFVPCLFVVEVLYYFISKLSISSTISICVLCAVIGALMSKQYYNITTLPWSIDSAFVALPFYAFGNLVIMYLSHEKIQKGVDNNLLWVGFAATIITIIFLIGVHQKGYVSLGHNSLGKKIWLFYLNAFFGSISTILFSLLLSSILNREWLQKPIIFIRWLGKNSFYAMSTHLPLKSIILILLAQLLHSDSISGICSNIWISLAVFIATLLFTTFVICLINKAKEMVLVTIV